MKSKFIKCACYSHGLDLMYHEEENAEDELYISIWEQGHTQNHSLSFIQRIRWCWKVLRTGQPYGDEVILYKHSAKELKEFLEEYYDRN